MLLLILDSRCALESARQGLELCIRTVIPSLFPFLFLSALVTSALWGNSGKILQLAARAVQLPPGAEPLFLAGFLGGYPAGASAIGSAYRSGRLQKKTACQLLRFSCNAGPAFLFGMIGPQLPEVWMVWCLWGIHILSAALVGCFSSCPERVQQVSNGQDLSLRDILSDCIKTMGLVCGWILLFRILIGFLDRWFLWLLPDPARVFVWGLFELSNGCCALAQIGNVSVQFVVASAMVSFGGICVTLQTASVISGLPIEAYITGKLMQTAFSILLAASVMQGWGVLALLLCFVLMILPGRSKKRSSILTVSIV